MMDTDRIKGNWKEFRGRVQRKWGEITDDELDRINGSRRELMGIIQKRYGMAKEQVQREIRDLEGD